MARFFLLKSLLEEAHALDKLEMRRQANQIRSLSLLTRDDDYVNVYRLSKEFIEQLEQETFISQPSASRCIHEDVEALNHPEIVKKIYKVPAKFTRKTNLKRKFGIPGIIGCIDGTLVALKKPADNEERFYCRKGYHARNVQLITDADNILNVDPTYGGATHNSFIFNYCIIKEYLEALTNAGEEVVFLGDSGYGQRAYLMTPISDAEDNSPDALYNDLHSTARNSVERTKGLLKGRFRCLLVHRVIDYHPDVVAKIVIACCFLHNMCNRAGMPALQISEEERLEEAQGIAEVQKRQTRDLPSNTNLAIGQIRRQNLVNRLWCSYHN
ncbi:hypothetical protein ABMA27_009086 [Loxostege sticticalis]|uniref:DDE Tnp4 domain-containing protein n=1 Tax=Loxostege sticticalis TaxID=481309 RepID=A0ABR3H9W1_LOXSC